MAKLKELRSIFITIITICVVFLCFNLLFTTGNNKKREAVKDKNELCGKMLEERHEDEVLAVVDKIVKYGSEIPEWKKQRIQEFCNVELFTFSYSKKSEWKDLEVYYDGKPLDLKGTVTEKECLTALVNKNFDELRSFLVDADNEWTNLFAELWRLHRTYHFTLKEALENKNNSDSEWGIWMYAFSDENKKIMNDWYPDDTIHMPICPICRSYYLHNKEFYETTDDKNVMDGSKWPYHKTDIDFADMIALVAERFFDYVFDCFEESLKGQLSPKIKAVQKEKESYWEKEHVREERAEAARRINEKRQEINKYNAWPLYTAEKFRSMYEAVGNDYEAANKWEGKEIRLTGTVTDIQRETMITNGMLTLGTYNTMWDYYRDEKSVHFSSSVKKASANGYDYYTFDPLDFHRGDTITVACTIKKNEIFKGDVILEVEAILSHKKK